MSSCIGTTSIVLKTLAQRRRSWCRKSTRCSSTMNALEHTYFALYVMRRGERVVEHLIAGWRSSIDSRGVSSRPAFSASRMIGTSFT